MSVMIKGMEMPQSCDSCRIMAFEDTNCVEELYCGCPIVFKAHPPGADRRPDYCPLVPVADVQPVVRGEWIQVVRKNFHDEEYRLTRCTACGYEMNNKVFFEPWDFHFCPNCGAKMEV